jgi:hypothetical protein
MDLLFEKIHALHKANQEIIDRIENSKTTQLYGYWFDYDSYGFMQLNEDKTLKSACGRAIH